MIILDKSILLSVLKNKRDYFISKMNEISSSETGGSLEDNLLIENFSMLTNTITKQINYIFNSKEFDFEIKGIKNQEKEGA